MNLYQNEGKFRQLETPCYYYDQKLMEKTLAEAVRCVSSVPSSMLHYAVKANNNPHLLRLVRDMGLGADCVSGGEVRLCLESGIPAHKIMFAGVGKTDREIRYGLENDILCFNAESMEEIEILDGLAAEMGRKARVSIRLNPNIDAHTHKNITTGLEDNKFGISLTQMIPAIRQITQSPSLDFFGLHFHIGSQIVQYECFKELCLKINQLQDELEGAGIAPVGHIDVGGGLGVDYENPLEGEMPDFEGYFQVFRQHLKLRPGQHVHFELGRSLTAQWGALLTRVTLVKKGQNKQFAVVDAGFTDLIRPAFYQARHRIVNLSSRKDAEGRYDVVGPICESSDVFAEGVSLPEVRRGDILAILSAGAYGKVMASTYNSRTLPEEIIF